MFCSNCGVEMSENAKFCSNCGVEIGVVISKEKLEKKKLNKKIIIIVGIIITLIIGTLLLINNFKMSKEQMLEVAIDYSGYDTDRYHKTSRYFVDLANNIAKAEKEKGKILKIQDNISRIDKDYCEFNYGLVKIRIYLSNIDLLNLQNGNNIKIVGKLTNIKKEKSEFGDEYIFILKNCFVIE